MSRTPQQIKLAELKKIFPEVFSEGKVDWEKLKDNPKKVIGLDKLFNGNDQLKTNTTLQLKDAGIEFKTI